MNKAIGIAVAIAAAALAIYFFIGRSADDSASSSAEGAHSASKEAGAFGKADERGEGPGFQRPLRMSGTEEEEPSGRAPTGRAPREYVRDDGTVVRDHRGAEFSADYERRVTMPRSVSPVQPETLAAVRTALRPAMNKCIAAHAPQAPEGAMAQAVLTVSITGELLSVDKLQVSTEGLEEHDALKECITEIMLGHQQLVAGAKDVDAHTMTFPYKL